MAGNLLVHFALAVKRRNERKRLAGWNRWLAASADIGRLLHELPIKALDLVGIARRHIRGAPVGSARARLDVVPADDGGVGCRRQRCIGRGGLLVGGEQDRRDRKS